MHTTLPNQCTYQVSTFYTLWNPRNSLDKILKLMVTITWSKVKSRSHHDVAQLQPLRNVPTKYQFPTLYCFRDTAWKKFYRSRSLRQDQKSNQGHTMTLHTYNSQPMSLQSINFVHLTVPRYSPDKMLLARSLLRRSNQGHTMTLHTYNSYPMSLPSINFLHLMVFEI